MMPLPLLLRRSPALATLSDEQIERLAGAFAVAAYPDGHVFIREGDVGDDVFLLVAGEVAVLRQGGELNHLRPGALFGLMALVDAGPRSATCRADGECHVGLLTRQAADALFHDAAPVALAFQRAVAKQLAHDFRHLNDLLRHHLGGNQTGARLLK